MAVVFSLMFGRFALVFTAFCLYVAVPLVRFSTFFFSFFSRFIYSGGVFFGCVRGAFLGVFWGGGIGGGVITSCRLRFT